jgi:hypothetical protein
MKKERIASLKLLAQTVSENNEIELKLGKKCLLNASITEVGDGYTFNLNVKALKSKKIDKSEVHLFYELSQNGDIISALKYPTGPIVSRHLEESCQFFWLQQKSLLFSLSDRSFDRILKLLLNNQRLYH